MAIKSVGDPDPTHSLSQLADLIWGNEILFGQISKIGNDGHETVMVFDSDHLVPAPTDETSRTSVVPATAPAPANALAFLCTGKVFAAGAEVDVKVYRT